MPTVSRAGGNGRHLILDVDDIPRIIEAFFLTSTSRPGPVFIDIPKDIQ
jgi:thiamine pyrophosphate-dependent acetolactate synthase large subunit-like protein